MSTTTATTKSLNEQERLTLRHLVQHVSRTFFDVDQVVAVDLLTKHEVLKDEDLAGRVGANAKETAKRLGKLVNIGLIQCHSQNEQRDATTNRSSVRKYYYIDYAMFVNLVKWGIAEMRRNIDDKVRNELADKGYICPRCRTTYMMLDADRLFDPFRNGFFCENCDSEVTDNNPDDEEPDPNGGGSKGQKMQRFNARSERIVSLLKKTDEMVLPKLDIIDWVRKNAEAQHAQALANASLQAGGSGADGTPASNGYEGLKIAGINGTGAPTASKVSVEIIDMDEKERMRRRREKEEEGEMRRQQNALPAWYTHSTISGEATAFGVKNDALLSPPPRQNPLPAPGPVIAPPSLSSLGGLDALVTMDDDDDFNEDEDEDEDVKPSLIPDVKPKLADVTPEARADYYAKYYANLEAQQSEVSSTPGLSVPNAGSQRAVSSAASSPFGSVNSPLPTTGLTTMDDDHSDSDGDKHTRPPSSSLGKKRAREDDDFADSDEVALEPPAPAKSGVTVNVAGVPMDFSDVTDDHHDLMTPEEYEAYFEVASTIG